MVQNRLKEAELQLNTNSTNYKTALQSLNIMMGSGAGGCCSFDRFYSKSALGS